MTMMSQRKWLARGSQEDNGVINLRLSQEAADWLLTFLNDRGWIERPDGVAKDRYIFAFEHDCLVSRMETEVH